MWVALQCVIPPLPLHPPTLAEKEGALRFKGAALQPCRLLSSVTQHACRVVAPTPAFRHQVFHVYVSSRAPVHKRLAHLVLFMYSLSTSPVIRVVAKDMLKHQTAPSSKSQKGFKKTFLLFFGVFCVFSASQLSWHFSEGHVAPITPMIPHEKIPCQSSHCPYPCVTDPENTSHLSPHPCVTHTGGSLSS